MVGKQLSIKVTPGEALGLFPYATSEELCIAMDLYKAYRSAHSVDADRVWDLMSLLAFAYITGRVQGIREERSKKKGA